MPGPSDKNKNKGKAKSERDVKREKARRLMEGRAESKFRSNRGAEEIAQLEALIDDLQHAYQLYFTGVSNIDPSDKRMKVNHLIAKLHEMKITNPRLKFKLQSLLGRWVTLKNYWDRILREIEKGTFKRTLAREPAAAPRTKGKWRSYYSDRKEPPEGWDNEAKTPPDQWTDATREESSQAGSAPTTWRDSQGGNAARPTTAGAKAPQQWNGGQTSNSGADRIWKEVAEARKSLSLPPISKEKLERTLQAQKQRIKQKYACDDVDFRVEVRNGKVVLKPVPIKRRSRT